MTTIWLIDTSAIGRLHLAVNAVEWADRIDRGLVRISTVTRLEVGFSARSAQDHRALFGDPPIASMPVENLTPTIEARAIAVQSVLAERGQHRAPSIELIAELTGQPVERLGVG